MKKQLLLLAMMLLPMVASAKQVRIDDIDYELYTENNNNYARVIRNFWKPNKFEYKGHIVIPETVTYKKKVYVVREIGGMRAELKGAFEDCYGLLSVTLPQTIQVISRNAFKNCTNLTEISLPEGLEHIRGSAFYGCTGLTNIVFPKSLKGIGDSYADTQGAFELCTGLTKIIIPDELEAIGKEAFRSCHNLQTVIIGDGVKFIGKDAFSNCENITNITLGKNVRSIGESAFEGCRSLTKVIIPATIKTIDKFAFWNCKNIRSITCLAKEPPQIKAFVDMTSTVTKETFHYDKPLYVPKGCVLKYKAAFGWREFVDIQELDE